MKKSIFNKAIITLMLAFVFTVSLPQSFNLSNNICVVKAADEDETATYLNVTSKSLVKEATFTLKVFNYSMEYTPKFKSSNSDVASVNNKGVITANKVGTATITVTVRKNFKIVETLECEITVGPPAISVKLNKTELILMVGDKSTTLKAILKPSNTADEVSYVSINPNVATVTSTGRVIALSEGNALIVATAGDKFDTCSVVVKPFVEEKETPETTTSN